MSLFALVLVILAAISFALGALRTPAKIDWLCAGFAFLTCAYLVKTHL